MWMDEALIMLGNNEDTETVSYPAILDYLAFAVYKV